MEQGPIVVRHRRKEKGGEYNHATIEFGRTLLYLNSSVSKNVSENNIYDIYQCKI